MAAQQDNGVRDNGSLPGLDPGNSGFDSHHSDASTTESRLLGWRLVWDQEREQREFDSPLSDC